MRSRPFGPAGTAEPVFLESLTEKTRPTVNSARNSSRFLRFICIPEQSSARLASDALASFCLASQNLKEPLFVQSHIAKWGRILGNSADVLICLLYAIFNTTETCAFASSGTNCSRGDVTTPSSHDVRLVLGSSEGFGVASGQNH